MDQFDIEMTYRRCSHVPITYFDGEQQQASYCPGITALVTRMSWACGGDDRHILLASVSAGSYDWLVNKLFSDPVPFEEKVSAVAYINSNCAAPSNRNGIVQVSTCVLEYAPSLCSCLHITKQHSCPAWLCFTV
jgi:hypothetical protein